MEQTATEQPAPKSAGLSSKATAATAAASAVQPLPSQTADAAGERNEKQRTTIEVTETEKNANVTDTTISTAAAAENNSSLPSTPSEQTKVTGDNETTTSGAISAPNTAPAVTGAAELSLEARLNAHVQSALALYRAFQVPVTVAVAAIFLSGYGLIMLRWIADQVVALIRSAVGITLGVGLGLGLATHVRDQLDTWKAQQTLLEEQQQESSGGNADATGSSSTSLEMQQKLAAATIASRSLHHAGPSSSFNNQHSQSEQDEQTYVALMQSAGYYGAATSVQSKVMRGHVLRRDNTFWKRNYPFAPGRSDDNNSSNTNSARNHHHHSAKQEQNATLRAATAASVMQSLWPTLPSQVNAKLAAFVEIVMRDFVSSWYSSVDKGIYYQEERAKRRERSERQRAAAAAAQDKQQPASSNDPPSSSRIMVCRAGPYRRIPLIECLYESISIMFGNAAMRTEHLNVFELVLLKWTRVLAHTFKVYRALRRQVQLRIHMHQRTLRQQQGQQQRDRDRSGRGSTSNATSSIQDATSRRDSSINPIAAAVGASSGVTLPSMTLGGGGGNDQDKDQVEHDEKARAAAAAVAASTAGSNIPVSEMAMTKEFLFSGKLHRAITFGLDVPSLLFADASGKECGIGNATDRWSDDVFAVRAAVDPKTGAPMTDDDVLEARLYGVKNSTNPDDMGIMAECELDYIRVLAHRIVRALLPRQDFGSPIVSTIFTEIFSGSILSPIYSLFCPDYINGWIIKGLSPADSTNEEVDTTGEGETISEYRTNGETIAGEEQQQRTLSECSAGSDCSEGNPPQTPLTDNTSLPRTASTRTAAATTSSSTDVPELKDTALESTTTTTRAAPSEYNSDDILTLIAKAVMDLQRFVDFEEFRWARENNEATNVDWDNPECRSAVLKLVLVMELVLAHGRCTDRSLQRQQQDKSIEFEDDADENDENVNDDEGPAVTVEYESSTLTQLLMEMTSDVEAFEERAVNENTLLAANEADSDDDSDSVDCDHAYSYKPTSLEQSTIRTLIAAWLHTGQIYRTVDVLVQAHATILKPYYRKSAFLRNSINARAFCRQLRALDGVDVLVDTMTVLQSPRMDEQPGKEALQELVQKQYGAAAKSGEDKTENLRNTKTPVATQDRGNDGNDDSSANMSGAAQLLPATPVMSSFAVTASSFGTAVPRYLDFDRNEAFAASLRSERERRKQSWDTVVREAGFSDSSDRSMSLSSQPHSMVCRTRGVTPSDIALHRELHHLSRIFCTGTNLLTIRDAARRKNSTESLITSPQQAEQFAEQQSVTTETTVQVSLLTVETASPQRRIEVPDDDSSFLLRAQPRALNAVGVHRDQRNHDMSFKCFAASYEEPAVRERKTSGRYIRRCLVRYYPIDRTAGVVLHPTDYHQSRKVDQRRLIIPQRNNDNSAVPNTITVVDRDHHASTMTAFLSTDFLRKRHLCERWNPKGTARSQSLLGGSVMEPTDFTAVPRTGKAVDFVYRCSFFEKPMISLAGKHFTIHDSSKHSTHRADASSIELSDAALSTALYILSEEGHNHGTGAPRKSAVEMGKDGYPVLWMKFSASRKPDTASSDAGMASGTASSSSPAPFEVKPYRVSFVRAALMLTEARQEAQLQSLLKCVKAGSAKKATKSLTDARLRPCQVLLEYAGNKSREKQSAVLRDLKLGVNHIDREQLRRNGLLSPRYPTALRDFKVIVEDGVQAKDVRSIIDLATMTGSSSSGIFYKIRCVATVDVVALPEELEGDNSYRVADDSGNSVIGRSFREEWVVFRSFNEIQVLHKHLKTQVSVAESSGTAGSRLVGAATAAFAVSSNISTVAGSLGTAQHGQQHLSQRQQRQALIPSLSAANKVGALVETQSSIVKRKEILDGYFGYLLSPGHLLRRCPELLLFLGAFYPLPPGIRAGKPDAISSGVSDPLGRTAMTRTIVTRTNSFSGTRIGGDQLQRRSSSNKEVSAIVTGVEEDDSLSDSSNDDEEGGVMEDNLMSGGQQEQRKGRKKKKAAAIIPAVRAKVTKVRLSQVRNHVFELLRFQFGFDNASFIRNRMLEALKTVSVAVTSNSQFQKMLYDLHIKQLSAQAVSGWIQFVMDILWPDGAFMQAVPPLTAQQLQEQNVKAKNALHESFPEHIRTVLGQDLTKSGLDMLHEMLQNRIVVKSMAYMLLDLVWLEVFPEIGDVLPCGAALDLDSETI